MDPPCPEVQRGPRCSVGVFKGPVRPYNEVVKSQGGMNFLSPILPLTPHFDPRSLPFIGEALSKQQTTANFFSASDINRNLMPHFPDPGKRTHLQRAEKGAWPNRHKQWAVSSSPFSVAWRWDVQFAHNFFLLWKRGLIQRWMDGRMGRV